MKNSIPASISFLKEIIVIMMGLALTNAVARFVLVDSSDLGLRAFSQFSIDQMVVFVLLLLIIVRFFHGNWMHLNITFPANEGEEIDHTDDSRVELNYLIVMIQSLILGALSFYQSLFDHFFVLLAGLLVLDTVGFLLLMQFEDREKFFLQRQWILNNLLGSIAMIVACILGSSVMSNFTALAIIAYVNTFVGLFISWRFYFPNGKQQSLAEE